MKDYLFKLFNYNDLANRKLIDAIGLLHDPSEALRIFSHLITAPEKWFNRLSHEFDDASLNWFGPVYPYDELATRWDKCHTRWINLLGQTGEIDLDNFIKFKRPADGKLFAVRLVDLMLQINYHGIHHRAQILPMFRQQGLTPPVTDYIMTVIREMD